MLFERTRDVLEDDGYVNWSEAESMYSHCASQWDVQDPLEGRPFRLFVNGAGGITAVWDWPHDEDRTQPKHTYWVWSPLVSQWVPT